MKPVRCLLYSALFCLVLFFSSSYVQAATIRQISLGTNDLIFEKFTNRVYASVPSSIGVGGNSIACIDPYLASVYSKTYIGSEPGKLAISSNGEYIYTALNGAAAIRRYHVPSQTSGLQFALGMNSHGFLFAEDLDVMPGNPNVIAVSRKNTGYSPRHEGVAIYDNGVMRSTTTPGHTGSNVIDFSDSPNVLYGYNNETTEYGFRTMAVSASGVTTTNVASNLISGFGSDFAYDNGRIYATNGRVLDPVTKTLLGTFSASGSCMVPDSSIRKTFFLTGSGSTYTLRSFCQDTFVPLGTLSITGVSGTPSSLVRYGGNGIAFRTSGNQVFLVETDLVPEPGSLCMMASMLCGLGIFLQRRRRR